MINIFYIIVAKEIWKKQHAFQILYWFVVFYCNPSRKHAKYGHCWHKHNAAKSDAKVVTRFEMNAKHSESRSDQVFKMSSTSFYTSSSVRNMTSTANAGIADIVREFGATHSLQQWVLAHDASSGTSTSNSDVQPVIPKSDEFLSLVKFDVWFCDSLVHPPDSKSIHWRCRQCAHCEVTRFLDALSYCQHFFFTTYSDQKPPILCQQILC